MKDCCFVRLRLRLRQRLLEIVLTLVKSFWGRARPLPQERGRDHGFIRMGAARRALTCVERGEGYGIIGVVLRAPSPGGEGWGEGGSTSIHHSLQFFCKLLVLLLALTFGMSPLSRAAEEPTKKTLFLPKSPVAAAYMLARLSNKELVEAPRSEFVYVALLQRAGLDRKYRLEALDGLAKARNTDTLAELIRGLAELDKKSENSLPVLRELATLLLQKTPADLAKKREDLDKLTTEGELPLTRQAGYAALVTADGSVDKTWSAVESESAKFADLLRSVPLVRDNALRAGLYPKLQP